MAISQIGIVEFDDLLFSNSYCPHFVTYNSFSSCIFLELTVAVMSTTMNFLNRLLCPVLVTSYTIFFSLAKRLNALTFAPVL